MVARHKIFPIGKRKWIRDATAVVQEKVSLLRFMELRYLSTCRIV